MSTNTESRRHRSFALGLALAFGLSASLVFGLNSAVDPLWFFGGNQLTGKNFGFDERNAKLNQLLRTPAAYDCVIFGSSRATWMPVDALTPLRCFNLAFSAGQVEEFVAFARYLRHRGFRPRHLVIGVDGFNFETRGRDPVSIPQHVAELAAPPSPLPAYLSVDSLSMSWRTLAGRMNSPGYYDRNFAKVVSDRAPTFRPDVTLAAEGLQRADASSRRDNNFETRNAVLYKALLDVFPEADSVGYVPPISAWHIAELDKHGTLDNYLDALFATARYFPVFFDFSVPSAVTMRTDTTYDGSHYLPEYNRSIGAALIARKTGSWGIDLKGLDRKRYGDLYRQALAEFRETRVVPR